jgi:hypothetical protein
MLEFDSRGYIKLRANIDLLDPTVYNTLPQILTSDKNAQHYINVLQSCLEDLRLYRTRLATRAQIIETAAYTLRLSLIRSRYDLNSSVFYDVFLEKVFTDPSIKPVKLETFHFRGRERLEAKNKFDELKKQYPGIDTFVDINKKTWEI